MKKLIIAGVVATLSFVGGLVGLYHLVPLVAPERAAEARRYVDSLSAAGLIGVPNLADSSLLAAGTPVAVAVAADSTSAAGDSTAALGPLADGAPERDAPEETSARVLADTVHALQGRLRAAERERADLQARLETRAQARTTQDAEVTELAGTLASLEDRELGAILQQLDIDIVRSLYDRTSARNRARLLRAMPPERAARFVQRVVAPDRAEAVPAGLSESDATAARQ